MPSGFAASFYRTIMCRLAKMGFSLIYTQDGLEFDIFF